MKACEVLKKNGFDSAKLDNVKMIIVDGSDTEITVDLDKEVVDFNLTDENSICLYVEG